MVIVKIMKNWYRLFFKRAFDIVFSIIGTIFLFPIMLIIAALVKILIGSPVIFKQQRPGLHGKIFVLYKFRTMKDLYDTNGKILPDEKRLTQFGFFLRRADLDELPELWNILKGDMSFVGPRPLLVEYLNKYTPEQFKRHDVRPGLTSIGIVMRNEITWKQQFSFDVQYVENMTFWLDVKLVFYTIYTIIFRKGRKKDIKTRDKFSCNVSEENR